MVNIAFNRKLMAKKKKKRRNCDLYRLFNNYYGLATKRRHRNLFIKKDCVTGFQPDTRGKNKN